MTEPTSRRPQPVWWLVVAVVVGIGVGWLVVALVSDALADRNQVQSTPGQSQAASYGLPADSKTPVPDCRLSTLPGQVEDAVEAVHEDGPFLRSKDGSTFRNAERLLPTQREGYYREYTVAHPTADFPGPRRLVVGNRGSQWFYTADHYDSFCEVLAG